VIIAVESSRQMIELTSMYGPRLGGSARCPRSRACPVGRPARSPSPRPRLRRSFREGRTRLRSCQRNSPRQGNQQEGTRDLMGAPEWPQRPSRGTRRAGAAIGRAEAVGFCAGRARRTASTPTTGIAGWPRARADQARRSRRGEPPRLASAAGPRAAPGPGLAGCKYRCSMPVWRDAPARSRRQEKLAS